MPSSPQPKHFRLSLVLVLLALAAGGGVYLFSSEKTPEWFSFLIPSSSYAPSEQERIAAEEARKAQKPEDAHNTVRQNIVAESSKASTPPADVPPAPAPSLPEPPAGPPLESPESTARPPALPEKPAEEPAAPQVSREPSPPEPLEDKSTRKALPPPDKEEPSLPRPAENAAGTARDTQRKTGATAKDSVVHPVIVYGKAQPINPSASAVRGRIPEKQTPAELPLLDEARNAAGHSRPQAPVREDNVVPLALVEDMARFLASNFWPAGSHPMSREKAISTASVKWANIKYGSALQGFTVDHMQPDKERERLLRYIFVPSMINGLYALYGQRFLDCLDREARLQRRGEENLLLTNAQLADMYELYAGLARSLAETVRAYMRTPDIRDLVSEYTRASNDASEAYRVFASGLQQKPASDLENARRYQETIVLREQRREDLAAALRRNGNVRDLDPDSLVYTAQWLYRRGLGKEDSFSALAMVLDTCAAKMLAVGGRYRTVQ